ncbi:ABC transporter ATP-binding protein [Alkaliphilus sp. B6464]|uniref:ABC transporter ATP-binding protein n=1 Tax=Alkaliphilus sp. B6464 TaxID=2731219 RepID=UPI001BA62DE2|nr:ABC transporter ATP-binding protein [Alkaliphilus sp. B6464]QUH18528.1 ABC transporter ATP-binding protein [Alkaliphilus sp. B6464]
MNYLLELNDVSKKYKEFQLNNISFNLEKGYIMGFIGPNGAGKSTTIKLIMNLIKKDGGQIKIFGKDYKKDEIAIKERIGFVYDENYFYEDLSLLGMKNIIAPFYKNWDEKTFQKYIKEFNLSLKQKIKELYKGMKMKYSLALALSHNADLIIMDEPTSGLDPIIRNELLEILYDIIQDEDKGILFSTHNTTDLDKIADYITFINDGKMLFSKPKDEIMNQYKVVKGGKEALSSDIRKKLIGVKEHNCGFEGLTINSLLLKKELKNEIIIENATLEDIMLYTVRGNKK